MSYPYLSVLPYHWDSGQILGCYLGNNSTILVGIAHVSAGTHFFPSPSFLIKMQGGYNVRNLPLDPQALLCQIWSYNYFLRSVLENSTEQLICSVILKCLNQYLTLTFAEKKNFLRRRMYLSLGAEKSDDNLLLLPSFHVWGLSSCRASLRLKKTLSSFFFSTCLSSFRRPPVRRESIDRGRDATAQFFDFAPERFTLSKRQS